MIINSNVEYIWTEFGKEELREVFLNVVVDLLDGAVSGVVEFVERPRFRHLVFYDVVRIRFESRNRSLLHSINCDSHE